MYMYVSSDTRRCIMKKFKILTLSLFVLLLVACSHGESKNTPVSSNGEYIISQGALAGSALQLKDLKIDQDNGSKLFIYAKNNSDAILAMIFNDEVVGEIGANEDFEYSTDVNFSKCNILLVRADGDVDLEYKIYQK